MRKDGSYKVTVVGAQVWDSSHDNVDVEVCLADGKTYGATFFTLTNLEELFEKNRKTGECASGLYLWASNMILVRELSMESIERTVKDLMANDEFESAFAYLEQRPSSNRLG
jgi:hypothetical protein